MDSTKPTVPDYDPGDSSIPRRPLRPLVAARMAEIEAAEHLQVLQAIAAALGAAVDLHQPHRTAARALTVQSMVKVAAEHPDRLPWLLSALDQLVRSWHGEPGGAA